MAQNQKSYDNEFKAQAVKLAQEIGAHKAANELGIPKGTMYTWIKAFKEGRLSANEDVYKRQPFKMEQSGSDKAYSFCVPPSGKCCRVAVYEAAIETIAHMTLEGNRTDKYRLSVGGIYAPKDGRRKKEEKPPLALEHFLENHPEITQIEICTNNDGPGRYACETMKRTYRDRYEILINLPEREGADYADLSKEAWEKKEKNRMER